VKSSYRSYFEDESTPNSRFARKVTNKLLDAAGLDKSEWEIIVIDSPEVNAYVLPGCKKIVVFKGKKKKKNYSYLLLCLKNN